MKASNHILTLFQNADGMRISKTVNGTKTEYSYLGSQLVEMKQGSNTLHFTYDSLGPATVVYNGTTYYYLKNAQGDVYGITNSSGSRVVTYTYDAWGKLLSTTGSAASALGALNPLRYRGYVYDTETGFYYLQTRYYNPDICRFINADGYASTGQGLLGSNAFAYCCNEPIDRTDDVGTCYYNKNGQWCHDNWEYLNGYQRLPDPRAVDRAKNGVGDNYSKNDLQNDLAALGAPYFCGGADTNGTAATIYNSYRVTDVEIQKMMCTLIASASNENGEPLTRRTVTNLMIEWDLHNSALHFLEPGSQSFESAIHVDLDYDHDRRSYISIPVNILEGYYYSSIYGGLPQ